MVDLAHVTQGAGQVIRTDEYDVDSGNIHDLVKVFHGFPALCLKNYDGILSLAEIFAAGDGAKACGTHKAAGTAGTNGRELRRRDSSPCLFGRVDLGNHDSACAYIQSLIDPDVGSSGNPDHRANASNICSTNQVRKGLKGGSSVLHIQQNEVISGAAGSFHKSGIRSDHKGA